MNADEIRLMRKTYRLTQGELAHAFHVTAQTIYNWEHRGSVPRPFEEAALLRLKKMLNVPEDKERALQTLLEARNVTTLLNGLFGAPCAQ